MDKNRDKLLTFAEPTIPTFELVFYHRNAQGDIIGKPKSIKSNDGYKIWQTWQSNQPIRKKGGKTKHGKKSLPKGRQAEKILNDINNYAEHKQKERT